jgi:CTP:molybdopterin cytidylyltransferase MocA
MLAAAILSAGESRRMGSPKALLPYRGRTFLEHLVEVTTHPRVGVHKIVLGAGAQSIREKLGLDPSTVVVNENWQQGQLSSIQAAVRSLALGETEGLILCPVDHPLVSAELVARLIAAFDESGKLIVLPTYKGKRGHPLLFRANLYEEILAASPEVGARQVVWNHAADLLEVPTDEEGITLNLNNPDALKKALEKTS